MPTLGRAALRLIIAPTALAAFAAIELWHAGARTALGTGWLVFALCVFAVDAWGKIQLARARRRLRSFAGPRARKTR
jgi:hypothetical protein